jgi:hypothetical protein
MSGLSRGIKIFLAVDAVLVLVLVIAGAIVLTGGGDDGDSTAGDRTPAATAGATGSGSAPDASDGSSPQATGADAATFASPSGNISCTMSADGVTCTIAHITFAPPVVEGCTGSTGHLVVLNTDGVTVPCVEGADPAVASADVTVLDYGRAEQVGPYTCTSATNGVTCVVEESGVGFRVATAELATLP